MNNDNTSKGYSGQSSGKTGGVGTKVKGATQVVHGFGENVRGTVLGAIDTVTHKESDNDEIARKGRLEMEEGMAKIKGHKAGGGQAGGADTTSNTQGQGRDDKHPTGTSGAPTAGTGGDWHPDSKGNGHEGSAGGAAAGATAAEIGQHRNGAATSDEYPTGTGGPQGAGGTYTQAGQGNNTQSALGGPAPNSGAAGGIGNNDNNNIGRPAGAVPGGNPQAGFGGDGNRDTGGHHTGGINEGGRAGNNTQTGFPSHGNDHHKGEAAALAAGATAVGAGQRHKDNTTAGNQHIQSSERDHQGGPPGYDDSTGPTSGYNGQARDTDGRPGSSQNPYDSGTAVAGGGAGGFHPNLGPQTGTRSNQGFQSNKDLGGRKEDGGGGTDNGFGTHANDHRNGKRDAGALVAGAAAAEVGHHHRDDAISSDQHVHPSAQGHQATPAGPATGYGDNVTSDSRYNAGGTHNQQDSGTAAASGGVGGFHPNIDPQTGTKTDQGFQSNKDRSERNENGGTDNQTGFGSHANDHRNGKRDAGALAAGAAAAEVGHHHRDDATSSDQHVHPFGQSQQTTPATGYGNNVTSDSKYNAGGTQNQRDSGTAALGGGAGGFHPNYDEQTGTRGGQGFEQGKDGNERTKNIGGSTDAQSGLGDRGNDHHSGKRDAGALAAGAAAAEVGHHHRDDAISGDQHVQSSRQVQQITPATGYSDNTTSGSKHNTAGTQNYPDSGTAGAGAGGLHPNQDEQSGTREGQSFQVDEGRGDRGGERSVAGTGTQPGFATQGTDRRDGPKDPGAFTSQLVQSPGQDQQGLHTTGYGDNAKSSPGYIVHPESRGVNGGTGAAGNQDSRTAAAGGGAGGFGHNLNLQGLEPDKDRGGEYARGEEQFDPGNLTHHGEGKGAPGGFGEGQGNGNVDIQQGQQQGQSLLGGQQKGPSVLQSST